MWRKKINCAHTFNFSSNVKKKTNYKEKSTESVEKHQTIAHQGNKKTSNGGDLHGATYAIAMFYT